MKKGRFLWSAHRITESPIFMIDDDTSMACLTDEEKNRISHRAKALEKLAAELSKK